MLKEILSRLEEKESRIIELRRHFHQNPENSFEEFETAKYIANFYKDLDVEIETNVGGGNGIRVVIDTKKPGKTIALRADFDALPLMEDTGLEFASTNGSMHACGHDGHTAYLLVLAETLVEFKDKLNGRIVIIHQPAEETPPGGALEMINAGALDDVDNAFGIHVMSQMDFGTVYTHKGATQQSRAKFILKVKGKGGHGSSPHEANDAIVAASHIVVALQTIVSRRISPFDTGVISIGSFDGKGTFNIIKESVTLEGDVRCMSDEVSELIEREVKKISEGIAKAFACDIDIEYIHDYPVLMNDDEMTQLVSDAVTEADFGVDVKNCGPQAPSEDFAYFTRKIPSCFFYVGANKGNSFPHHHPKFDIDERALLICAKAMASVVYKYCNR